MKIPYAGISVAVLLAGCAAGPNETKPDFSDQSKATLLMTVGEGWVFQSGQAYAVLSGNTGAFRVSSMTDPSGGAGTADKVVEGARGYEFNAISVAPGTYAITDWGFAKRRGMATRRSLGGVNVEAGKVYYIGSFYAVNLTQTASHTNEWNSEKASYLQKYPELSSKTINNVSGEFAGPCWKMDVSDEIAADNSVIRKVVSTCR